MVRSEEKTCKLCGECFSSRNEKTLFEEAGEWLAEDFWQDAGDLCSRCLENRGRLAMMYLHERNS